MRVLATYRWTLALTVVALAVHALGLGGDFQLDRARLDLMRPFYKARKKYFDYAYEDAYELEILLDPVITIHPDEIGFEAFSKDESIYGRVAAKYDLFKKIDEFECGTTNVDFSARLSRLSNRHLSDAKIGITVRQA